MSRFAYVKYDEESARKQQDLKTAFEEVEKLVDVLLPPGRSKSLCLTALEESYMWTGKSIRDEQIIKDGGVSEQKERSNG